MMGKLGGCIYWLKMMTYWSNIILFGIKSTIILRKNLVANVNAIKSFWKSK